MYVPHPEPEKVVLWIGGSSSTCGGCNQETLPQWDTHEEITGYGSPRPGCGARFTHVASTYGLDESAIKMRPDLILESMGWLGADV